MILGADFVVNDYTQDALDETGLNMISFSMEPFLRDGKYFENNKKRYQDIIRNDNFVFTEFPTEWDFHDDGEFTDEGIELFRNAITTFSTLGVDGHVFDLDYSEFTLEQFKTLVKLTLECSGNHANLYYKYKPEMSDEKLQFIMDEPGWLRFGLDADSIISGLQFERLRSVEERLNWISTSLEIFDQYYVDQDKRGEYPKDSPGRAYSNFLDQWQGNLKLSDEAYFKVDECSVNEVDEFITIAQRRGFLDA